MKWAAPSAVSVEHFRAVDLPAGLSTRPLQHEDAHAVFEVMAAQEAADLDEVMIEEADIVGDWSRPSFDVAGSTVGVFDGDRLVAYGEVGPAGRCDAAVHPDFRGRGIGTALAHWMQDNARAKGLAGDRDAGAGGLARRPPARGARLPGPLEQLGARAARGRGDPGARAARGVRRTRGRPVGVRAGLDGPGGRLPRVVGPRPRAVRGLAGRGHRAARLRAVEHPRGGRPRRRRRSRWPGCSSARSRRSSPGSRPGRTSAAAAWRRRCSSTRSRPARQHGAVRSELSTDSRTGALALYEKVGMVVTSTWVNLALDL